MAESLLVLKLKLDSPPAELLDDLAASCRRATNAGVEDWLLRHRGRPESAAQAKTSAKTGKALTEETKIYHAMRVVAPELFAETCSQLSGKLWQNLKAKLDWRERVGDERKRDRRRKDAILDYEIRPPFTSQNLIPVANKHLTVNYGDRIELELRSLHRDGVLKVYVAGKKLPTGIKRHLLKASNGEQKMSDSSLVKRDDQWFLHLVLKVTYRAELPKDREVVLRPTTEPASGKNWDRPFRMVFPSGGHWSVGDGRYLLGQTQRLIGLKKQIGYRYRNRCGAGHGRKKVDRAVRLRSQQLKNVRDEFRRRLIKDIIKQCERHQAGTVIYREPSNPVKMRLWFHQQGLDFDWTRFLGDLRNAAARRGVAVKVKQLKKKELVDAESS